MAATSRSFTFLLFFTIFLSRFPDIPWDLTSHQSQPQVPLSVHVVRYMICTVTVFSPGQGLNQLAQLLSSKPITTSSGSFLHFNFPLENFDIQSINLTLYSTWLKQILWNRQEKSYCIFVWRRIPNTFLLFNVLSENLMMYHLFLLQWHIF